MAQRNPTSQFSLFYQRSNDKIQVVGCIIRGGCQGMCIKSWTNPVKVSFPPPRPMKLHKGILWSVHEASPPISLLNHLGMLAVPQHGRTCTPLLGFSEPRWAHTGFDLQGGHSTRHCSHPKAKMIILLENLSPFTLQCAPIPCSSSCQEPWCRTEKRPPCGNPLPAHQSTVSTARVAKEWSGRPEEPSICKLPRNRGLMYYRTSVVGELIGVMAQREQRLHLSLEYVWVSGSSHKPKS